ncbi:MAG: undecaprenyl/decaprenyl-phosphate alpha-N-acetylglucosaminyl 1-phosphate transferase [Candidatus Marinimicrobia bacterium]|nr:undecaprenyl/decaprenyl-phosphate alpha-N-acetylglucosaminyl 1-phosphate transferase [Candidatus Neomarinimicrobiota bacterium]
MQSLQINKNKLLYAKSIFLPFAAAMVYYNPVRQALINRDEYFYYILFTFLLSFGLAPFFHKLGNMLDITDKPGGRHHHTVVTPLTGGIPVFIAFIATTYLTLEIPDEFYGLFWSSMVIMIIGIIDDVKPVPALFKLLAQLVAIGILVHYDITFKFFGASLVGKSASILLTFIWIAGITNGLNCLDGMDGLASGIALLVSLFYALIARINGNIFMASVSLILAVAILGFFPYNFRWNKSALIFLGDNGSTFIGFLLASLSIYGEWGGLNSIKIAIPLLVLAVPITDMTMTTVMRIYHGHVTNFFDLLGYTGRDHLHHRIQKLGITNHETVMAILFFNLIMGLLSLMIIQGTTFQSIIALSIGILLFFMLCFLIIKFDKSN